MKLKHASLIYGKSFKQQASILNGKYIQENAHIEKGMNNLQIHVVVTKECMLLSHDRDYLT
jgi:hypothetical protein